MFLIFDTETTGLPKDFSAPISDINNWPRCIQLAWQLHDFSGKLIDIKNYIIKPDGFSIPYNSEKIHGISTKRAQLEGHSVDFVLKEFSSALSKSSYLVGHNISFDINIIFSEYFRINQFFTIEKLERKKLFIKRDEKSWQTLDTMTENSANYCQISGGRYGKFKFPKLTELYEKLFGKAFLEAHNASVDVAATARCFFESLRLKIINPDNVFSDDQNKSFFESNKTVISVFNSIPNIQNLNNERADEKKIIENTTNNNIQKQEIKTPDLGNQFFIHLHCHSSFSVLQSTVSIDGLIDAAVQHNMPAIGLTDFGNLFGAFKFVKNCKEKNIKPILGCELFLTENHKKKNFY